MAGHSVDLPLKGLLSSDPFLLSEGGNVSRHQLLSAAYRFSETLPDAPVVLNLYARRDVFLMVMLAVAMRGGKTVLPPNVAANTLTELTAELEASQTQTVQRFSEQEGPESGPTPESFLSADKSNWVDEAVLQPIWDRVLNSDIWLYTSGSTGQPKRVVKTWRQMALLAQQAIARFELNQPGYVVATVPSQHMFGLETTIFWPLFSKQSIWVGRPIFAEDIRAVLAAQAGPVLLASTPLHLKKLMPFDVDWPQLPLRVLSATAPLEQALAQQVSDTLHARVFEVFGSTETASIASRETLAGDAWTLYDDNFLLCEESLSVCEVNIAPLAESHPLHDQFELIPGQPNRFRLLGRRSDVVKVAGKRSSLAYLNQKLQAIDGVSDGLFWQAPNGERLQAFVVSDLNAHDIKQALAQDMDAVFLPRPIHFVEQIPRNELGKIQFQQLSELAKQNTMQKGTQSPNVRA
ncbi:AMP-binding protein [Hydrogenovibrio thermophilus]|uniref:Acyl-CoA synthetase n=1 Tax=Hydrogenovibrio thermophilus TaxID=265883 RepID=A0A451G421_9GAMM|nr:AMP-binding protein [Hydrogenovibrio thermophilus]QAB14203.1 acyl-CoA synthetase [Hydrogenovibrio thermophilus]